MGLLHEPICLSLGIREVIVMASMKRVELRETTWKDDRGWGINPLEAAGLSRESLGNLHVVSIEPGAIRGNHYHTSATEWILICSGPAKVVWRSRDADSIHETLVSGTEPALFEIPPNVGHAVLNNSKGYVYLISFSDSYERGTVRCSSLFDSIEGKGKSDDRDAFC
jgi:dTDP-4-dehydrorhamnose 3,5-epimerase-like enzyme